MNKRTYLANHLLLSRVAMRRQAGWLAVGLPAIFRRQFASCRDVARPELAGRRQQMAQSLAACRYHLPPFPRCQLEQDIPNCYDFLKVETKDSGTPFVLWCFNLFPVSRRTL
jgi:hypothetical protein